MPATHYESKGSGNQPALLKIPTYYLTDESPKAYCFSLADGKVWLPKSQIQDWQVDKANCSFWIPTWLVERNGLEHFIDTSYAPTFSFDE